MKEEDVRTLTRYRLEQAQTALDDAQFLLDGRRSAQGIVNRAYYAMFYAILALLQDIGQVPSKHVGAIGLFDREFVAKGVFPRELSRYLHRAFEFRQTSDYKVTESISRRNAEEVLSHAVQFVAAVREHLTQEKPERQE